jgi:hypothetical protein
MRRIMEARSFMKMSLLGMSLLVILGLGGCSTGPVVVSEWRNPVYASGSFRRIMIGGPAGEVSVRRSFEDEFVSQLRAIGIDALPSYRFIPEDQGTDETKLKQAAQKADVDAVLFARSIHVERKTDAPTVVPSTSFGWFGSNFGISWHSLFGGYSGSSYNEYTSETTLYDIPKQEVVWTGTIKTREAENARTAIRSYVQAVMKALDEKNLIRSRQ